MVEVTNPAGETGLLADAMKGADIFVGVSAPNIVSEEMVASMNKDAILFAMANPIPEIMPDAAKSAGARIVGTGRSDFPNQVNNVIAFPGIFKGALEGRARQITDEMKLAAALAIADLVKEQRINGISDLRDESDRDGMRIVIELRRDVQADVLLNQLYRLTSLQTTFGVNNIVLVNNVVLSASNKRDTQEILETEIYDVPKIAILKMCLISFNGFSSIADMNPGQTKEFIDEIFGFKLFTEYNQIVQEEKRQIQNAVIKLMAMHEENNNQINNLKEKKRQQQMQLDSSIDLTSLRSERLAYVEEGKACKEEYTKIDNKYKEEEEEINNEKLSYFKKKSEYATLGKQEKNFINTFKDGKCPTCSHEVDPSLMEAHRVKMLEYAAAYKVEESNENIAKLYALLVYQSTLYPKYPIKISLFIIAY